MPLSAGTKIGPYEVLAAIGAGGMGEVYLAQDHRLGRKVALKVLSEKIASKEDARFRFLKEARAASALNNPHIVTVHDIITQDHSDVIIMEYLEGESLRAIISRGKIDINRSLDIAADIASALAGAHSAGIIHRDIKPENILITRTNVTKVLDFGLAKLVGRDQNIEASQLQTASTPATQEGTILGTVAYMSPEQAQGQLVDQRTDIFSLGVVLLEMLTAKQPFQSNSTIDTLHAILHKDPVQTPPSDWPNELTDTIARALAKNPEERYQHAGDFALDLRKAKRSIDQIKLRPPPAAKQSTVWRYSFFAVLIVCALLAFALWKSQRAAGTKTADEDFYQSVTLRPLTVDPGYEFAPTFSPDGETIAYVSDRTGNFEIFLKQISGGPDINLTNHPADDVNPSFSPDGKQIAFMSTRASTSVLQYAGSDMPLYGGDIWVMPALGGSAKRIVENANFPTWSPDGSRILFNSGSRFRQKLYTIAPTGGMKTEIAIHFASGSPPFLHYPIYSPSGDWILFVASNYIWALSSKGGDPRILLKGTSPCLAWA